jgi:hypothetical protein
MPVGRYARSLQHFSVMPLLYQKQRRHEPDDVALLNEPWSHADGRYFGAKSGDRRGGLLS